MKCEAHHVTGFPHSWHLLGWTDAPLGCVARLLSEQAKLAIKPSVRLAADIEPDGNWLHITCLLQFKKVYSQCASWNSLGAEKNKTKKNIGIHICRSSRLQGQFTASRQQEWGWKGRWLTERGGTLSAQQDWWLAEADIEGQADVGGGFFFCRYQGAWSMEGPKSLSSMSRGSMGFALGNGSLKKQMNRDKLDECESTLSQTPACSHTSTRSTHTHTHTLHILWKYNKPLRNVISLNQAAP